MKTNVDLIHHFYTAFQNLDHKGMNRCYSDEITFFDPVYGLLRAEEVKFMWEMVCQNATDLTITYGNITELDDEYCTCEWTANYTYAGTGRKVNQAIKANMRIRGGKIIEHSDAFSLHSWSKQARGFTGELFGWNSFYQRKIKNRARKDLLNFIRSRSLQF